MLRRIFFLCLYLYSFLYMMSTHISRTVERCVMCYLMLSESRSQKVCSVQCSMVYNSGDLTTGELRSTGICQWLHEYRALWYDLAHFLLIVSFPTIALSTIFPYQHIFPWKRALALVLDLRVDSLVSTFLKTSSLKQVLRKGWTVWQTCFCGNDLNQEIRFKKQIQIISPALSVSPYRVPHTKSISSPWDTAQ